MKIVRSLLQIVKIACSLQFKSDGGYKSDPEISSAMDEVKRREQDFECAEDRFVESAALYLRAAEEKLKVLIKEKRDKELNFLANGVRNC